VRCHATPAARSRRRFFAGVLFVVGGSSVDFTSALSSVELLDVTGGASAWQFSDPLPDVREGCAAGFAGGVASGINACRIVACR
jgi:hypothetical protein